MNLRESIDQFPVSHKDILTQIITCLIYKMNTIFQNATKLFVQSNSIPTTSIRFNKNLESAMQSQYLARKDWQ